MDAKTKYGIIFTRKNKRGKIEITVENDRSRGETLSYIN